MNQFRNDRLPLVYLPKAERIHQAVSKLAVHDGPESFASGVDQSSRAAEVRFLDLPAFREIVECKKAILLDARPEAFHRFGHIPGAISLSREQFQADYVKQRPLLQRDRAKLIVVYCSDSDCDDSQMVADGLVKLGFLNICVFKGGWEDWTAAHLPEEKAE